MYGSWVRVPLKSRIKIKIMNLKHTTIFDLILYFIMVLFIIGVLIGACIENDLLISISTIIIFLIVFIFLIINTYRFLHKKEDENNI
jgi:low affinity Fe/Cu permease